MFFTKVVKAKIGIYKKHKFLDPFFCEKHPIQKCQPLDHSALSTLVSNSLTPVWWTCHLTGLSLADENHSMLDDGLTWAISCWKSAMIADVCSRFWRWILVIILKLKFGEDFEAEVWSKFWGWILINLWLKSNYEEYLNLGSTVPLAMFVIIITVRWFRNWSGLR